MKKSKSKSKKAPKTKAKSAKKNVKTVKKATAKANLGVPYGDRVLVKPMQAEETTSFGLIIPDSSKEKPEQGIVVAVGEGKRNAEGRIIPLSVKAGDKIMFSKYGFDEIKINGTEYYLIREDSITFIF